MGALIVTAGHDGDGDPPGLYDVRYPAMMATLSPGPLQEICIFSGKGTGHEGDGDAPGTL